jgi:glycosyltransferase involved in cell wall biosynthesis
MRILVNPNVMAPIGGVELSSLQVSRELVKRGHNVDVLYRESGSLEAHWSRVADTLTQVPSFDFSKSRAVGDLMRLRPAIRAAAAARPDVVYLNRAEQAVWGILAARQARTPLVVHLRTHPDFPGVRTVGRIGAEFIAVSHYVSDLWIKAGLPPHKVTVVHNGVDPADYPTGGLPERAAARAALGLPQDVFIALCYGRVSPGKGVDLLLEAWRRLGLPPERARLVIVGGHDAWEGDGYLRSLQASQPPGCIWLPPRQDVVPALHAADAVVLPAQWQEPFGRVVIEAMASGRPVIGTRAGGIPEMLAAEFPEFLVDPDDPAEMAARLAGLTDWRTATPDLGFRLTEHVRSKFSLTRTVDGVEAVLERAVQAAHPGDAWSKNPRRVGSRVSI